MKKLFSVFGLLALFLFPVQAFAQSVSLIPMLAVCQLDSGQIEVTFGVQAYGADAQVSAVEGHLLLANMTYNKEEYGGNVNLPTTTQTLTTGEQEVVTTTGLVNYFDVKTTEPTAFYKLICDVASGAQSIKVKVDLDGTTIYPGSTDVNLTPFTLSKDDNVQVYEEQLYNIPFCEPKCGNGAVEGEEECDDGNTVNGDGCSSTCKKESATTTTTTTTTPPATTTPTTTTPTTTTTTTTTASILPSTSPNMHGASTTIPTQPLTDAELQAMEQAGLAAALHGASLITPQAVELRNAAALQETGPRENALIVVVGLALMWTLYRFRHLLQK